MNEKKAMLTDLKREIEQKAQLLREHEEQSKNKEISF